MKPGNLRVVAQGAKSSGEKPEDENKFVWRLVFGQGAFLLGAYAPHLQHTPQNTIEEQERRIDDKTAVYL